MKACFWLSHDGAARRSNCCSIDATGLARQVLSLALAAHNTPPYTSSQAPPAISHCNRKPLGSPASIASHPLSFSRDKHPHFAANMLARTALARLRAKVPSAAARDVAQLSRQLQTAIARANSTNNAAALAPLTLAQFQRIRSYATATKTGAAKKAPVKKTTATKKPAPKKPAPKKTATTKKAAPKKKPAAKKKKAAARPKKELTDEQKERLAERKEKRKELRAVQKKKDDLKELKAIALEEPKQKPATAFQILMAETVQKDLKGTKGGEGIGPIAKAVSERYKNLSPAELEVGGPLCSLLFFDT